jgi:hypothetical protein
MDRRWRFARAEDKITRLSKQGLDMVAFWRACTPVLADAVPHYVAPCCYTIDPASGLVTSHFQEGMPEFPAEWFAMEYAEDDVNQLTDVARLSSGISTLYEATGGDPSSSRRWHANMTYGGDQEMIAALRTRGGDVWGAIGLYREPDRPLFDPDEKGFLAAISPLMADAVRRALLIGESADPEGPDAPGMIVLGPRLAPGVDFTRCRGVASRLTGRKLGGLSAADRCAFRGGARSPFGYQRRRPGRSSGGSGADPLGPLGGAARRTAGYGRQSAGCCHRRTRAPKSDRPALDVGLWPDST